MAKRTATTELTDRNWDHEEEPEEAGEFSKATDDAMKQRHIIKAKRKNPASEMGGGSAFSGFGGFSFKPTQTSTPLMGFGQKTETKINFGIKPTWNDQPDTTSQTKKQNGEVTAAVKSGSTSNKSSHYMSNLKALNNSVLEWISQHVRKNPYCILTPIFRDYEKHLSELEKLKESSESKETNASSRSESQPNEQQMESAKPKESDIKPSPPKSGLTFGMGSLSASKSIPPTIAPSSGFFFGLPPATTTASTSGFSFAVGRSEPAKKLDTVSEGAAGDEDEYVPPKPEVKEIEEEGSLYSKKCKLFCQKDGAWTERGVGHLHLKKIDEKTQLVVRADTNLGNILLNIMLTSSVPLSRQGKNNVSMVCVPNPPIDPKDPNAQKPVPMLIRVKTSDDADELLGKMNEMKN